MKNTLKTNKRADITIAILVMGVFVLCGLTLLSFYFSGTSVVRDPSLGLDLMEKMNSHLEMHFSPENIQNEFREIKDIVFKSDLQGNRFFIIEKKQKEKLIFYVKYYLD